MFSTIPVNPQTFFVHSTSVRMYTSHHWLLLLLLLIIGLIRHFASSLKSALPSGFSEHTTQQRTILAFLNSHTFLSLSHSTHAHVYVSLYLALQLSLRAPPQVHFLLHYYCYLLTCTSAFRDTVSFRKLWWGWVCACMRLRATRAQVWVSAIGAAIKPCISTCVLV